MIEVFEVRHWLSEQKLSCFLSPLSLVSDVSEASAVTGQHRHLGQSGQGGYSVGLKAISVPLSVVSALLSSSPLPSRDRSVRSALRSLTVDLSLAFSLRDNGLIELSDSSDNLTPAVLNLEASIISNDESIHSVGYVVLDADEAGVAEDILYDIGQVSKRSASLFSSLESKGVTLNHSFNFSRSMQIINGQSLRFFSTQASSLSDLHDLADPRFA